MSEVRILSPRPRQPASGLKQRTKPNGEECAMAQARIPRPAKSAMQSGRARTRKWVLEYEPASRRDPDPLMGWSSARDTLNEVHLRFASLEDAVAFAAKHGLDYTVIEPHARTPKAKS